MSLRPYTAIFLVFTLACFELEAAEYDYYTDNPRARKEINIVIKHHWDNAVSAVDALRYKSGIAELDYILRYIPNHPRALLLLSKLTISLGRTSKADPYFENAIKFGPQYENSYSVYGIHLFRSGRYKKSIKKFKAALSINPNSSEIHYNIGLTYFAIKDIQNTKIHAQKAYILGYPFPGLREKLKSVGQWDEKIVSNPE